jgi:hypothetical protein
MNPSLKIEKEFMMPRLSKIRFMIVFLAVFLPALYASADPVVGTCQVFPLGNPWNMDVSALPVDPNSANYVANINANGPPSQRKVHPDFGDTQEYGIPYVTVNSSQLDVAINFDPDGYGDESDPGPYPVPGDAEVEGGDASDGDRHVLVIDTSDCMLYELYYAFPNNRPATSWTVYSSAKWDLDSAVVQQRPLDWTSADAAGLPIFPGLARCDEAMSGTISHAFRFTVNETQEKYVFPASHLTFGNTAPNYPPMGLRFRLKADYDLSGYDEVDNKQALAIATALKKYGMMLADNGSNWYISGEQDRGECWDDEDLEILKQIPGTAFEVVSIESAANAGPVVRTYFDVDQPTLTWGRVTWATGYEVQISANSTFAGAPLEPAATNVFTADPLDNGTYYWRVRAVGTGTGWSDPQSFVVLAP